jgi:HTH-type transcriptional regulator, transcriptional repressor of NAD biosynthesis genes
MGRAARSPVAWYGGSWAYTPPPPPAPQPRSPGPRPTDFGPSQPPGQGRGVILGRFLPPHLGHQYLIDFARAFTPELTLFLRISADDPIPGELRAAWLRELYPEAVVPVREAPPPPAAAALDERAGREWADIVRAAVPRVDYVFSSDELAPAFTAALGAQGVMVDGARRAVPISGSEIRKDPWGHWEFLPACVRPYYLRRVCLIGPEASGKTTLARRLADHYRTAWVSEQARAICGGAAWQPQQTQLIARSQVAAEEAGARSACRLLFCDTDLLAVRLWSERLFGLAPQWVREQAAARSSDLYLVTEAASAAPPPRREFLQRCLAELAQLGRPFVLLRGSWDERFAQACTAVDGLRPAPG